ncbi:MAG: amidohydrolase [Candidatus Woesearchaeota archaeon]|nr:amidohydrolase [Candidatus Woesearchaeota archaeon]
MLLKNCRFLVTQNDDREILEDVDVKIEGNQIAEIGNNLHDDAIIDCSNKIVMPGLINCHTHLGMTTLRGISDDKELEPWLKEIVDAEKKLTTEDIETGVHLGITEAIRTGTTTVLDMYDPIEPSINAATTMGMRMLAMKGYFAAHGNDMTITLPEGNELATVGLAPHSIYGVTEDFLKEASAYAATKNTQLHIHVAETRKERVACKKKHGKLPIEYLERIGFLSEHVSLAHCIWLTKGELDTIAKANTKVVHCPQANMKLAGGGVMPLQEMLERQIIVGLGTDSVASNNSLDMFREMHVAALLHKHHYWSGEVAQAQTILDMATRNGAHITKTNTGSIQVGKLADIITLDCNDVNVQPIDKERVISHIVYAANGMNVADVLINGEVRVQNKELVQ